MEPLNLLLLFLAGCLTGFLAGFFGVGGGIILVPILLYYFQSIGVSSLVATHLAFGTSLLVMIFTSLASSQEYYKSGQVVWRAVILIGLASVVGAAIGSVVAGSLHGKTLQRIFAAVVFVAAIRLVSETRKPKGEQIPNLAPSGLLLTGLVVGLVSALAGVGGGVFSVPITYSLLRFPLKRAIGTSSATIVITAVASTAGYMVRGWGNPLLPGSALGYVDYLYAIPLILGTVPLGRLGAKVSNNTRVALLRKIFAVFLLIVATKMFFL